MVLTRYQIRNEYGSADKDLYRAANKDDSEALLEGATMAGLVGVLRQLGDLAEFAAEVFYCLNQELMKTATRGHGLMMRLQELEAEFPITEKSMLSQTVYSTCFYDPGLDWHSNLQIEGNFIAPRNLPRFIMDSYEECSAPPQLFLLDKFDVAGSGSCLKRYSDPYSLRICDPSTLIVTSTRKQKKKKTHVNGGETPEASQTSHAKLHHLFLLDHDENGNKDHEFCVKLKRRQLNEPGRGYMEKFLNNPSPDSKRVHDTLDQSCQPKEIEATVPENLTKPSLVYSNCGDTRKYSEEEIKYFCDDENLEVPLLPQEITSNEKDLPANGPAICLERSSSVKLRCKVSNHTEALASMGKKAEEADSDDKADSNLVFPGFEQTQRSINAHETQTEVLPQVSNVLHQSMEEKDLQTGSENFSTPYLQEDVLVKSSLLEISSDDNGIEGSIPDIQSQDACFSDDVDQSNQTSSENNVASVTKHKKDLENISDHQGSVVGAQECISSEYCIQSHEEWQESPSKTVSADPTTTSVEFLPCPVSIHDAYIGLQGSLSGEALTCSSSQSFVESETKSQMQDSNLHNSEQIFPLRIIEVDALQAAHQENDTSLHDHISESMPFVELTDQEKCLKVTPKNESTLECSNKTMEAPIASNSADTSDTKPESAVAESLDSDWRCEAMALEWFNQNLTEHTSLHSTKLEKESNLDHGALESPKETRSPQSLPDDKSYENQISEKFSEDKTSLVIAIDKSMLRKVSEEEKTPIGARVDENDSLLEIIRSKSFNLRPVDASARPNIQAAVPVTNLKVVAMLEKANTLRQAMVGSDDDDSNTWSD